MDGKIFYKQKKREKEKKPMDLRVMSKAGKGYVNGGWH